MQMVALNAYENGEEKFDNLYTGDMPQYQRCIKLLKCQIKQAIANIVLRKKQHIMIKVLKNV